MHLVSFSFAPADKAVRPHGDFDTAYRQGELVRITLASLIRKLATPVPELVLK